MQLMPLHLTRQYTLRKKEILCVNSDVYLIYFDNEITETILLSQRTQFSIHI